MLELRFFVFWKLLNYSVELLKYIEFYIVYFIGKNCEYNFFLIDIKFNSKLFKRMDNLYFFF